MIVDREKKNRVIKAKFPLIISLQTQSDFTGFSKFTVLLHGSECRIYADNHRIALYLQNKLHFQTLRGWGGWWGASGRKCVKNQHFHSEERLQQAKIPSCLNFNFGQVHP